MKLNIFKREEWHDSSILYFVSKNPPDNHILTYSWQWPEQWRKHQIFEDLKAETVIFRFEWDMWGEDRIDFIYEIVENSYFLFIIPLSCSKETKPVIRRQIRFFFIAGLIRALQRTACVSKQWIRRSGYG